MTKQVVQVDQVIIRFAGDSGDGMQLTGDRFTSETAASFEEMYSPSADAIGRTRTATTDWMML